MKLNQHCELSTMHAARDLGEGFASNLTHANTQAVHWSQCVLQNVVLHETRQL